jgi:hypothetical protein
MPGNYIPLRQYPLRLEFRQHYWAPLIHFPHVQTCSRRRSGPPPECFRAMLPKSFGSFCVCPFVCWRLSESEISLFNIDFGMDVPLLFPSEWLHWNIHPSFPVQVHLLIPQITRSKSIKCDSIVNVSVFRFARGNWLPWFLQSCNHLRPWLGKCFIGALCCPTTKPFWNSQQHDIRNLLVLRPFFLGVPIMKKLVFISSWASDWVFSCKISASTFWSGCLWVILLVSADNGIAGSWLPLHDFSAFCSLYDSPWRWAGESYSWGIDYWPLPLCDMILIDL